MMSASMRRHLLFVVPRFCFCFCFFFVRREMDLPGNPCRRRVREQRHAVHCRARARRVHTDAHGPSPLLLLLPRPRPRPPRSGRGYVCPVWHCASSSSSDQSGVDTQRSTPTRACRTCAHGFTGQVCCACVWRGRWWGLYKVQEQKGNQYGNVKSSTVHQERRRRIRHTTLGFLDWALLRTPRFSSHALPDDRGSSRPLQHFLFLSFFLFFSNHFIVCVGPQPTSGCLCVVHLGPLVRPTQG